MSSVKSLAETEQVALKESVPPGDKKPARRVLFLGVAGLVVAAIGMAWWAMPRRQTLPDLDYRPRQPLDNSGLGMVNENVRWSPSSSLEEIAKVWDKPGHRLMKTLEQYRSDPMTSDK